MNPTVDPALAVLGLDQLTKYWIMATMNLYEVQAIIPGLFNLVYVTNKGAAFSMLASSSMGLVCFNRPYDQRVIITAPATPINGSSQFHPKYLPDNNATMASKDVIASANT